MFTLMKLNKAICMLIIAAISSLAFAVQDDAGEGGILKSVEVEIIRHGLKDPQELRGMMSMTVRVWPREKAALLRARIEMFLDPLNNRPIIYELFPQDLQGSKQQSVYGIVRIDQSLSARYAIIGVFREGPEIHEVNLKEGDFR